MPKQKPYSEYKKPAGKKVESITQTGWAPNFWRREGTRAGNSLMATIGDLVNSTEDPSTIVQLIANSVKEEVDGYTSRFKSNTVRGKEQASNNKVQGAVQRYTDLNLMAQPMPSNIMTMLRMVEYMLATEGDVWQTVLIPAQIILKEWEISCQDKGARTLWREIFEDRLLLQTELQEQLFFQPEVYGAAYPLEVWDKPITDEDDKLVCNGSEIRGLAFLEPMSMWVGRHFNITQPPMSLVLPEEFSAAEFANMTKPLTYNSFVVDINKQYIPAQRVPIRQNYMKPVYTLGKMSFERYAIPPMARALREMMFRQLLDEYRRGSVEGYINQLWLFTVGDKDWPATPKKIAKFRQLVGQASQNRDGVLVTDHLVKGEVFRPETLDTMLGVDAWSEITASIFRKLGFSTFMISGELPGTKGRGGGTQVETDSQLALERWEHFQVRTRRYLMYMARKYAEVQNSDTLRKSIETLNFKTGAIGLQQTQAIKERLLPLIQMGKLSNQTALDNAGFNYQTELANKKEEEKDKDLFQIEPTFSQTVAKDDGEKGKTTETAPLGRPPAAQSKNLAKASENTVIGQGLPVAEEWRYEIIKNFDSMSPIEFTKYMQDSLPKMMIAAYQEGFDAYGGFGDIDAKLLQNAPQGMKFQLAHLKVFAQDLKGKSKTPANVLDLRNRAIQYAGAAHTAYVLGSQAAMKVHGAKYWQRILHPELSAGGPCNDCIADAAVVHKIDEPFMEFHPNGVCSAQSVNYHFEHSTPMDVSVPSFLNNLRRIFRRIPIGG